MSGIAALTVICAVACLAAVSILVAVRHLATPGDISQALSYNPSAYKLSLGHMEDLTLDSFAYLRLPLPLAAVAFFIGVSALSGDSERASYFAIAVMMVVFFHAARLAMVTFDPYLSSRPMVRGARSVAARRSDHRSSLLLVLVRLFLHQQNRAAAQRPILRSGLRIVCTAVRGSLHRQQPVSASLARRPRATTSLRRTTQLDDLASLVGRDQLITVMDKRRQGPPDKSSHFVDGPGGF